MSHRTSEAQYLQEQAEQAKKALSRSMELFGRQLGKSVNPRELTRSHPWASVGIAFGAAALIGATFSWDKVKSMGRSAAAEADEPDAPDERRARGEDAPPKKKHGLLKTLIHEAMVTMRPIILQTIAASFSSGDGRSDQSTNGHHSETEPRGAYPPSP